MSTIVDSVKSWLLKRVMLPPQLLNKYWVHPLSPISPFSKQTNKDLTTQNLDRESEPPFPAWLPLTTHVGGAPGNLKETLRYQSIKYVDNLEYKYIYGYGRCEESVICGWRGWYLGEMSHLDVEGDIYQQKWHKVRLSYFPHIWLLSLVTSQAAYGLKRWSVCFAWWSLAWMVPL